MCLDVGVNTVEQLWIYRCTDFDSMSCLRHCASKCAISQSVYDT
jgi:hypothetical protein